MKKVGAALLALIASPVFPFIVAGVVGLLIWKKLFGAQTAADVLDNAVSSAVTIPAGISSMIGSAVRGESEDTYVSQAAAKELAAAELAKHRGG